MNLVHKAEALLRSNSKEYTINKMLKEKSSRDTITNIKKAVDIAGGNLKKI
jgi:arsenate reductase-like glutaredoxin family protein